MKKCKKHRPHIRSKLFLALAINFILTRLDETPILEVIVILTENLPVVAADNQGLLEYKQHRK